MCILSDPVEYPDMFSGVPVGSSNINSQYQSYMLYMDAYLLLPGSLL